MDLLKRLTPTSTLWQSTVLIALLCVLSGQSFTVSAAAASEWSLGPSEEYVSAFINLTYLENKKLHTEKSEIGRFGNGKVGPASGIVVHVHGANNRTDVHHGCDYPYGNQIPNEPWIALVKRGNCSFDKKLENAYRSNASALVVYAKEDSEQLEKMSFRNCDYCDIPSIFTFKWKGDEIGRKVDADVKIYMYITVGEACTRPYSGINKTSVLFVSISFIVLMIISLCWLCFYYLQRFRYLHAKDRLAQRLCNAAKKALAKIPTRNVRLTDKEISGEVECCAVCIEIYRTGDTLRTLPCRHEYHKSCIDPWLLEHRTCPMCKMDILKYYGFIQFTGSQESILHLDMDEGALNSSESRETDSPDPPQQQHHHQVHHHAAHVDEQPHSSSVSVFPERHRKASLISLTVVASPRAIAYSRNGESPDNFDVGSSMKQSLSSPISVMFPTVELNSTTAVIDRHDRVSKSSLNEDQSSNSICLAPSSSIDDFEQDGQDFRKMRKHSPSTGSPVPVDNPPHPLVSLDVQTETGKVTVREPQTQSQQSKLTSNATHHKSPSSESVKSLTKNNSIS